MFRDSSRRVRERFNTVNSTMLLVTVAGLILLAVIALPRVYPAGQRGIQCTDLAAPIGGNNRSALSYAGGDAQSLGLEVKVDDPVSASQTMDVTVTFINEDIGPVILYLPGIDPLLTNDANSTGLNVEFTRAADGALLNDPSGARLPQIYAFDRSDLHLLGSRARCSVTVSISPQRMAEIGLGAGSDYRVRAIYRNNDAGTQATAVPNATATPAIPNGQFPPAPIQGVWTGEVSSNEERFTVSG
jgi:hypothetical protein